MLPLVPPIATKIGELMGDGEDGMIKGAELYLEELQAYRSENFPSTEEQDRELLRYCASSKFKGHSFGRERVGGSERVDWFVLLIGRLDIEALSAVNPSTHQIAHASLQHPGNLA